MSGFTYIPKVGKVYVVELTSSWDQILTPAQLKGARGFKAKGRYTPGSGAPLTFDLAFNSSPSSGTDSNGNGFYSVISGVGDMFANANGVWGRTRESSNVTIEILVYE